VSKLYYGRQEAANYLAERGAPVTKNTLQKLAVVGGGPEYLIFGNKALYTLESLDAWVASKLRTPRKSTSDIRRA
jgi:hypothetical protein